jgi:hypothetical protein
MENENLRENDEKIIKKIIISPLVPKKSKKEEKIIQKKEKSKRVITNHNSWQTDLSFETQYRILNEVKTQYNSSDPYHKFFISQIKRKINGYIYQDEKKDKLSRDLFIDLSNVLQKLLDSNMECYYCKKKIKVLYEYVREEDQWTLERIDNKEGHNTNNVEIACLSCNLRRRTMYHERYIFTKQMNIMKIG